MLLCGAQANVQIESGEGDGLPLGIFGGGRGGDLDCRLSGGLGGLGCSLAICICRAGEDDLVIDLWFVRG